MSSARLLLGSFVFPASFLLLSVLTSTGCNRSSSGAEGDAGEWSSRLNVLIEEEEGELRLVLEGDSEWYVNTLYPGLSVTLSGPDEEAVLGREVVRFEDELGEDKAKRAAFPVPKEIVEGQSLLRGTYRAVVCKEDACSPPFSGEISLPAPAP